MTGTKANTDRRTWYRQQAEVGGALVKLQMRSITRDPDPVVDLAHVQTARSAAHYGRLALAEDPLTNRCPDCWLAIERGVCPTCGFTVPLVMGEVRDTLSIAYYDTNDSVLRTRIADLLKKLGVIR